MIQHLKSDAKTYVKILMPELADMDSTKFGDRFNLFGKIALSEMVRERIDANNPWYQKTSLTEATAPTLGTEKVATTVGDVYTVALVTGAYKIAGDSIILYKAASAEVFVCPRLLPSEIVLTGGSATQYAFWESRGRVNIYIKDGLFTVDPDFQYEYYVDIAFPATDSDPLDDILTEDFVTLCSKIATLFRNSI